MADHPRRYPTPLSSPDDRYRETRGAQWNIPLRPKVAPQQPSPSPSSSTSTRSSSSSPSRPAKRVRFSDAAEKIRKVSRSPKSISAHTLPTRPRVDASSRDDPPTRCEEHGIPPKCPEVPGQKRHEHQLKKDSRRNKKFEPSAMQNRLEKDKRQQRRPSSIYDRERDPDEVDEAFFLQKEDKSIRSYYEDKRLAAKAYMAQSAERRQRPGVRIDHALRTTGSYERLRPY